jgi:hypothetical protein
MATPRKTPVKSETLDVEQLLASEDIAEEATEETPEQRRIRELEQELSLEDERQLTNPTKNGRPLPEAALTEEQKKIRELEDRLARKKGRNDGPAAFEEAEDGILIHFVRDGFAALGQIWYRGQEIMFDPEGDAYEATKDRRGNSWVELAGDVAAQYSRWGDEFFRAGPFIPRPHENFDDEVAAEDKRRGRAAPIPAS